MPNFVTTEVLLLCVFHRHLYYQLKVFVAVFPNSKSLPGFGFVVTPVYILCTLWQQDVSMRGCEYHLLLTSQCPRTSTHSLEGQTDRRFSRAMRSTACVSSG